MQDVLRGNTRVGAVNFQLYFKVVIKQDQIQYLDHDFEIKSKICSFDLRLVLKHIWHSQDEFFRFLFCFLLHFFKLSAGHGFFLTEDIKLFSYLFKSMIICRLKGLVDNFHAITHNLENEMELVPNRALTRTLIDGAYCIFMYSCFGRQISFQFDAL